MNCGKKLTFLFHILLLLVFTETAPAAPVSEETAWRVARTFIKRHVTVHNGWKGHHNPTPASIEVVWYRGEPIGYNVSVNPGGHLLVAYYDGFSPILFYSPSSPLNPSKADDPNAIESWIIPEIYTIVQRLKSLNRPTAAAAGSFKASSKAATNVADRIDGAWNMLKDAAVDKAVPLAMKTAPASDTTPSFVGPLLATIWDQLPYYNQYTPAAAGCTNTPTGCVATAMAQVMKYWNWPDKGTGSNSYSWNGTTLSADFSHAYDWSSMPANLTDTSTPTQIDAVARLMSDIGVSVNMNYGCGSSSADPVAARNSLLTYFKYRNTASFITRQSLRQGHTATLLPSGKVFIAGGWDIMMSISKLYDPATGVFNATGEMVTPRGYHTATLLPNGKVLIVGGYDVNSSFLSSAELYDPATGTFSATDSMAKARAYHTATLLPSGQVLIAGGRSPDALALSSAELYDPASGSFTATGNMSSVRSSHTATLLPGGKVLIAGGGGSDGGALSSAELYDPATSSFNASGTMTSVRLDHTTTLLQNGTVLIAGGRWGPGWFKSAEIYDPVTNTFSVTGEMAMARDLPTATLLTNGTVLIAGGQNGTGNLNSAELYNPANGSFSATGDMAMARANHTATLLTGGTVLIGGTETNSELYDPVAGVFNDTGGWMETIKNELNAATPRVMLFSIVGASGSPGHEVVIDGYQTNVSGTDQVHINYGWGGSADGYYDITSNWSAGYEWSANSQTLVIGIEARATVPGAPSNVNATAGSAQATVTFSPPASDGGAAITSYTVTSNPDNITASGLSNPITVTGLTNGTAYSFTVTATNSVGTGPASAPSNSVTPVLAVNGSCGSTNGQFVTSAPTTDLCAAGTASTVALADSWHWGWTCQGANGGTDASCSANWLRYLVDFETNGNGGTLEGTTYQIVTLGESATTVTAVPNTGYSFAYWADAGAIVSLLPSFTATNVNARTTYTAHFYVPKDFNSDGNVDILWTDTSSNQSYAWIMNGLTRTASLQLPASPGTGWAIVGKGDFNYDGKTDIVWRNQSTGQNLVWFMNGLNLMGAPVNLPTISSAWTFGGAGDFNGDNKSDIVWRNQATGAVNVWYMNGVSRVSNGVGPTIKSPWIMGGIGDFDKDGVPDIVWRNPSTGAVNLWFMKANFTRRSNGIGPTIAAPWVIGGVADFDKDGVADILWRNPTTGANNVWYMSANFTRRNNGIGTVQAGSNWVIVGK